MEGNATRDGFARRSLLVGLIAIAFALSCTSAAAAAVVTARNSMEPTLVDRINDVRAAHGLRRLRVSSLLTNAATRHANSMGNVGYFKGELYTPSHSILWTPYGTWIHWYWPGAGYTSGAAGENRTWGAADLSARAAVKRWLNSKRHRLNLLTASWRRVGVAAVRVSDPVGYYGRRDDVTIVVAEFGRRKGKRRQVEPPPPPPPPPSPSPDNDVREDMAFILYSSGLFGYQTNVDKYGTCDVAEAYLGQVSAHPCNRLMYSAAMHAPDAAWAWWNPISEARADGYLLHRSDGSECATDGQYGLDVGDSNAQQDFIQGVMAKMAQYPWMTGVFTDGVGRSVQSFCGGAYPVEYPTQASWDDAMVEWASVVGPALRSAGIYQLPNAGGWYPNHDLVNTTREWWPRIAPYFPALTFEYWTMHPSSPRLASTGPAWDQLWNEKQALVAFAQGLGVDFYGIDQWYNDDPVGKTYGRVSFLLDWDGNGGGHFQTPRGTYNSTQDNWVAGMPSYDVGAPTAGKVQVGVGWRREFTKATVLINPDPAVSQSFSVGGSTVTLPPVTARIIGK
jgi:uncharacterized protein YkwD